MYFILYQNDKYMKNICGKEECIEIYTFALVSHINNVLYIDSMG